MREALNRLFSSKDYPHRMTDEGDDDMTIRMLGASDMPASVGPYSLREKLGEGTFGVVFSADQSQPLRRRVALKILKAGMDTKAVLARFDAERQALALMDHPNIAKVFDAGETERGRPYFAMELVKGVAITEYCDRHKLSIRERLELFLSVCHAIQHAHLKGIIHRDLKPSNILVGVAGDLALPKVIDFGMAKATGRALTDKTYFTEHGQLIGTPEYMSPEQAGVDSIDVDTRSDIYSLGMVLYELLTGVLPFDAESLRREGMMGLLRVIHQQEPAKPSTKVSTLGKGSSDAARLRRTGVHQLSNRLRGELDWIVLKAIEKDRTRRYDTASEFAAEIRRYLNDEPVLAGPPSSIYRFRKFAGRHKTALAVMALVFAGLSYGLIESNRQQVTLKQARDEAEAMTASLASQQVLLKQARDEAEAVTAFLASMLGSADPGEMGREVTVRRVLDQAAGTIAERFPDQPGIRSRLMETMGEVYRRLGLFEQARSLQEGSLAILEDVRGPDHPDLVSSLNKLALVHWSLGDFAAARPLFERAIAITEQESGESSPGMLTNLAIVLEQTGDYEGARRRYNQALAMQEERLGPDSEGVARILNNLGILLKRTGNYDGAQRHYERALAIWEQALGPDHPEVASVLNNLAVLHGVTGNSDLVTELNERVLAIREKAFGPDHPDVATSLNNLAYTHLRKEDYEAARPLLERALAIRSKVLVPDHPHLASTLFNLGILYRDTGDHERALPALQRALSIWEKLNNPGQVDGMEALASVYRELGDEPAARELEQQASAIREQDG